MEVDTSRIVESHYAGWNQLNGDLSQVTGEAFERLRGVYGMSDGVTTTVGESGSGSDAGEGDER